MAADSILAFRYCPKQNKWYLSSIKKADHTVVLIDKQVVGFVTNWSNFVQITFYHCTSSLSLPPLSTGSFHSRCYPGCSANVHGDGKWKLFSWVVRYLVKAPIREMLSVNKVYLFWEPFKKTLTIEAYSEPI